MLFLNTKNMMPYIQHDDSPYIREYMHINPSLLSNTSSRCTTTLSNHSDNCMESATSSHDTETLKWFFKAVSAVDHSYKETTENLNKLVSFYL